jgi:L-alanine-DL-glutamate epimerase-like enolase superfamily enzyme
LDAAALSQRRHQLQARAEQHGIDVQARLGGLPLDDDAVVIGALATLLGLSITLAFDAGVGLDELTRISEERRAEQLTPEMVEQYATELREAGGQSGE